MEWQRTAAAFAVLHHKEHLSASVLLFPTQYAAHKVERLISSAVKSNVVWLIIYFPCERCNRSGALRHTGVGRIVPKFNSLVLHRDFEVSASETQMFEP